MVSLKIKQQAQDMKRLHFKTMSLGFNLLIIHVLHPLRQVSAHPAETSLFAGAPTLDHERGPRPQVRVTPGALECSLMSTQSAFQTRSDSASSPQRVQARSPSLPNRGGEAHGAWL